MNSTDQPVRVNQDRSPTGAHGWEETLNKYSHTIFFVSYPDPVRSTCVLNMKSNPSGSECSWAVADDMRCAEYIFLCTCLNAVCIWLIHSTGFNETFPMTDQQPFWQSQKTWLSYNHLETVCLWLVSHTWLFYVYIVRNKGFKSFLPEGQRFYQQVFFEDRVFCKN